VRKVRIVSDKKSAASTDMRKEGSGAFVLANRWRYRGKDVMSRKVSVVFALEEVGAFSLREISAGLLLEEALKKGTLPSKRDKFSQEEVCLVGKKGEGGRVYQVGTKACNPCRKKKSEHLFEQEKGSPRSVGRVCQERLKRKSGDSCREGGREGAASHEGKRGGAFSRRASCLESYLLQGEGPFVPERGPRFFRPKWKHEGPRKRKVLCYECGGH